MPHHETAAEDSCASATITEGEVAGTCYIRGILIEITQITHIRCAFMGFKAVYANNIYRYKCY